MKFISLWIFIIIILSFLSIGKVFYEEDNTQDITNITNQLEWNETRYNSLIENTSKDMNLSMRNTIRIKNIIYKGISNVGFIFFEISKIGIELGYENPEYNYLWFAKIIIYILILCMVLTIIPILPIIIAIIYLLIKALINLIKAIKKKTKGGTKSDYTKTIKKKSFR